jgi:hypothetical protein
MNVAQQILNFNAYAHLVSTRKQFCWHLVENKVLIEIKKK